MRENTPFSLNCKKTRVANTPGTDQNTKCAYFTFFHKSANNFNKSLKLSPFVIIFQSPTSFALFKRVQISAQNFLNKFLEIYAV